jgi:hypothetical protein
MSLEHVIFNESRRKTTLLNKRRVVATVFDEYKITVLNICKKGVVVIEREFEKNDEK